MKDDIAQALRETLFSPNVLDSNLEPANVVDALAKLGDDIRYAMKWLGNADAATPMGALEAHGQCVLEGAQAIAAAIHELAEAVNYASAPSVDS